MKNIIYILLAVSLTFTYCTPKKSDSISKTKNEVNMDVKATDQEFRKTAPAAGPAKEIKTGEYTSFTLDNGLKVIVVENHKIPKVSYTLQLDRNPIVEGENAGYINLAGTLLTSGTANRTKAEINEEIDFIGARLYSSSTSVYATALKKHQDVLLDVMTDVIYNPTFPVEEFEKEKKKMKSNIASSLTDPNAISSNVSNQVLYGKNHPYGENTTDETIENVSIDLVKNYYNTYFKPNISYLIIVGDISSDEAKSQAEKYFGKWEAGDIPENTVPKVNINDHRKVVFVNQPGAVQSVIRIANPVEMKPGDDMELAAAVANNILGGGVFSGYLMQNLREDKAYTYGARSSLRPDEHIGMFTASASVRNEVTDSSVVEFLRELNRIRNEKVDAKHLELTKNSMAGSFARSLENPRTVANQAYRIAKYNMPKDYYDTYLQRLEAITAEDVAEAANKYIKPNQVSIIIVGNKEIAEKLTRFSHNEEIQYLDSKGNEVSQEAKVLPQGVTAENVLQDYIKAIGGKDAIKDIKNLSWKMAASIQGMEIKSERIIVAPNKMFENQSTQGMEISKTIYDGEKAKASSPQGSKDITEANELEEYKQTSLIIPELYYTSNEYKTELIDIQSVDGVDAYNIKVTSPYGKVTNQLYAVDSGLKLREISAEQVQGRTISIVTKFEDYKTFNGVKFPGKLTITGAAPFPIELNTQSIDINTEVDNSIFVIE